MEETQESVLEVVEQEEAVPMSPAEPLRIPQYRRDIKPTNLVLSAKDLQEFCELIDEANSRAKKIEYENLDMSGFDSPEEALDRVNEFMPLDYNYIALSGDYVEGLGIPQTDGRTFPDELESFFVSNSAYAQRAIKIRPLNAVDVLLKFEKPSLKIDLQTLPSNPTENGSIINIYGRDEDWVISTAKRIEDFFERRKSFRPAIHGSGTYDYLVYLIFLPALMWLFYKKGQAAAVWLESQSVFMNVILGIYAILLSLLLARFIFQYVRWLFPPMEYYKTNRLGAFIHRGVAGILFSSLILSASYDIIKALISFLFGG